LLQCNEHVHGADGLVAAAASRSVGAIRQVVPAADLIAGLLR